MTDTKIIDGKATAEQMLSEIKGQIEALKFERGITPGLAVVLVGADPASQVYVSHKLKACEQVGVKSFERRLDENTSEQALLEEIKALNNNDQVHGILVQLPLPRHMDADLIINAIAPKKDVDGFHPQNIGKLWLGEPALQPCTPTGCVLLIKQVLKALSGKHAVIIGRSNIVGKPMAALLLKESCTVSICHSKTVNLETMVRQADIVVAAVGIADMVKGAWLKKGAVVIDVGINRMDGEGGKSRLVGDVDFDSCIGIAAAITPVPGGVGPMTVACLLENTLKAASRQ